METITSTMETPAGRVLIETTGTHVSRVSFTDSLPIVQEKASPLMNEVHRQLNAYFDGSLISFDLPLKPHGTVFQKTVWELLQKIPYGTTCTYLQLAKRLGNVNSIRAAAAANGKNPIAIIIPCHRVIGANGSLTGYAGGLHRKQWLLEHEARKSGNPSLFG